MAHGCCTNAACIDRETQLRLARLREELLTNFNVLLLDRIRFLEQTINRLSFSTTTTDTTIKPENIHTLAPTTPTPTTDRLSAPPPLRRSSSTSIFFLQSPADPHLTIAGAGARSCPSSVDLSSNNEHRRHLLSVKQYSRAQNRTSSESNSHCLPLPINSQWSSSSTDIISNPMANNEKGRLESRRFARDVDDNEVRAFKAMVYMEQARKQHTRPLSRLRQALGISSNTSTINYTINNTKKQSNS